MRRISAVKSQEDLKSDILCLKKKLTSIADENQLLKVRIRRLENELRRKNKYIECYKIDSQKDRAARRSLYDDGANVIYKLQKRNEELEDMLLERDLQNAKRYNDLKTMCLYSQLDCKPVNRRGSKTSVPSVTRLNSGHKSNPSSQISLHKIGSANRFNPKKPNRVWSSDSLGDQTISRPRIDPDESSRVIKILHSERLVDKRAIRSKNAEISRLSVELRETRNLLRKQEAPKIAKATSTTQLQQRKSYNQDANNHMRANFIEENKRNVRVKRPPRKLHRKTVEIKDTDRRTDLPKLPTVLELTEESTSTKGSCRASKIPDNRKEGKRGSTRPKTRIEYVYDSEVSSDGEEFCLPNTLRTFLQRAVNSKLSGRDEAISD